MRHKRRLLCAWMVAGACLSFAWTAAAAASPQTGPRLPGAGGGAIPKPPALVGTPFVKVHSVPAGQAEAVAKFLQPIYKTATMVRITALNSTTVAIWAGPEEQLAIANHVLALSSPALVVEFIPLKALDAGPSAGLLKALWPADGPPFLAADPARNGLLVRGTAQQIQEVREALRALGESGAAPTGKVRVIRLEKGSVGALAEALKGLLPQLRDNPVRVIVPGKQVPARPAKEGAKGSAKGSAPVTITAAGNKLIVASDDPQALVLIADLVRLLTTTPAGDGDFQVIRLRHARAADVVRVLDEAFNGPAKAPPAAGAARVERLRVVAGPATNSLLIKAAPLDVLMIRRLVEKELDVPATEEPASVLRNWVVGPLKHLQAAEAAKILQGIYRAGPRAANRLSVAVDDRANTLVLRCAEPLYREVERLVRALDELSSRKK